jgi:hypothetical protein
MTLSAQDTLQLSMGLPDIGERDRYAHVMSSGLADVCLISHVITGSPSF